MSNRHPLRTQLDGASRECRDSNQIDMRGVRIDMQPVRRETRTKRGGPRGKARVVATAIEDPIPEKASDARGVPRRCSTTMR